MLARIGPLALLLSLAGPAAAQPPGGPPPFELGRLFPPPLRDELRLTPEQETQLDALEREVRQKLERLLTDEQKATARRFRPRGPGGPGGQAGPGGQGGPPMGRPQDGGGEPNPRPNRGGGR